MAELHPNAVDTGVSLVGSGRIQDELERDCPKLLVKLGATSTSAHFGPISGKSPLVCDLFWAKLTGVGSRWAPIGLHSENWRVLRPGKMVAQGSRDLSVPTAGCPHRPAPTWPPSPPSIAQSSLPQAVPRRLPASAATARIHWRAAPRQPATSGRALYLARCGRRRPPPPPASPSEARRSSDATKRGGLGIAPGSTPHRRRVGPPIAPPPSPAPDRPRSFHRHVHPPVTLCCVCDPQPPALTVDVAA